MARNFAVTSRRDVGATISPALTSRAGATRETYISPDLRDRIAFWVCVLFFSVVALVVGMSAFGICLLIDWDGVTDSNLSLLNYG